MNWLVGAGLLLLTLMRPAHVSAHAFTPVAVWIEQLDAQQYKVSFRRSRQFADKLALDLPRTCSPQRAYQAIQGDQLVDHFVLTCQQRLQGQTLRVLGLSELSLVAVVQASFADGRNVREVLSAQKPGLLIPGTTWPIEVFQTYFKLGVEHLLFGWDHLLFVLGLLCLVKGAGALLGTLTAFTLGHSVTLALSALSVLRPTQSVVEVGIALSLLVVALQVTHKPAPGPSAGRTHLRAPAHAVAGAFGLLHGLGFAGALAEIGLPNRDIPLSLLAFNLGIEAGQVLSVSLLLIGYRLARRIGPLPLEGLRTTAAYCIGSLSIMWCIERVSALLG